MKKIIGVCGRICSGKTFYSRKLRDEEGALLLSLDELTMDLLEDCSGPMYEDLVARAQEYLMKKAGETARLGCTVILDWGFWNRAKRERLMQVCREYDVVCEWHCMDVDDEQWESLIDYRNELVSSGKVTGEFYVDEGLREKMRLMWEAPEAELIKRYIEVEMGED